MTTTFIPKLALIWKPLPMLVLGVPTVITGFLSLLLPETTDVDLPQCFDEGLEYIEMDKQKEKGNL